MEFFRILFLFVTLSAIVHSVPVLRNEAFPDIKSFATLCAPYTQGPQFRINKVTCFLCTLNLACLGLGPPPISTTSTTSSTTPSTTTSITSSSSSTTIPSTSSTMAATESEQ